MPSPTEPGPASRPSPALQALPLLKSRFPIERARMRLKLLVPLGCKDELVELVKQQGGVLEEQDLIGEGPGAGGGWRGLEGRHVRRGGAARCGAACGGVLA